MSGKKEKQFTRPRKSPAEKLRRFKTHQRRLIALGMSEAEVQKLNYRQARVLLRFPSKIKSKK